MNNKKKLNKKFKEIVKKQKELHFWKLPETIRIKLNRKYCQELFEKLLNNLGSEILAKKLGISRSHVYHLKNQKYSLKPSQLILISKILSEDLENIEKNIELVNTTRGGTAKFRFPLNVNEETASLIGHCFGDGSIFTKKPQFQFCNFDSKSLDEVKKIVEKQFKSPSISVAKTTVSYSSLVGEILHIFGAHRGHKLRLNVDVPDWIKNREEKIKSRFLRALFDDDGSVSSSKNNKNISFHQIVLEEYGIYSKRFLNSIINLLKEFDIKVHGPYLSRKYKIDGKTRNVNYILISDWESIKNFSNKINFLHSKKKIRLDKVLRRKKALSKFEKESIYNKILNIFEKNRNPVSTAFVSKELNMPDRQILKRLNRLQQDKFIVNVGRISNISFLWNLNGGKTK